MRVSMPSKNYPSISDQVHKNDNHVKQLLEETKHDIKNYPDRTRCYLPKPKAEVDNINRGLDNS